MSVPPAPLVTIPDGEPSTMHSRKKQWCFTLFYDSEEQFRVPTEVSSCYTYLVFQRESCPDTGRTHLQGYICFTLALRFATAKRRIMEVLETRIQPHIQYTRGSVDDNYRYCTKLESRVPGSSPVELGSRPVRSGGIQGSATKLARELILAGKSPIDVLRDEDNKDAWSTAIRCFNVWEKLVSALVPERNVMDDPTVLVFYGAPGTGKTRLAYEMHSDAYMKMEGKWWCHYRGQSTVIYDDFDGSFMRFGEWKKIFDRYPMLVEPKGGTIQLSCTTHIITTNVYPSHWWSKKTTGQGGRDALWRRITQLWYFEEGRRVASVYDDPAEFRAKFLLTLETQDPKGEK